MRNSTIQLASPNRTSNPSGIVGRAPQRPFGGTGESTGVFWRFLFWVCIWFHSLLLPAFEWLLASLVSRFRIRYGKGLIGNASGPRPMGGCTLALPASGTSRGSTVRAARRALFLLQLALTEAVQFKPVVPAEMLKPCALIG